MDWICSGRWNRSCKSFFPSWASQFELFVVLACADTAEFIFRVNSCLFLIPGASDLVSGPLASCCRACVKLTARATSEQRAGVCCHGENEIQNAEPLGTLRLVDGACMGLWCEPPAGQWGAGWAGVVAKGRSLCQSAGFSLSLSLLLSCCSLYLCPHWLRLPPSPSHISTNISFCKSTRAKGKNTHVGRAGGRGTLKI